MPHESPAPLRVRAARDLGPQFTDNPHRMVGQDGAYSIPLGGGEALWFFGDTLIGERPAESLWFVFGEPVGGRDMADAGPFEEMITNTGLIARDQTGRDGLRDFAYLLDGAGRLKKLVPAIAGERPHRDRIWCLHGCALGEKVYLYYIRIRMHEEGGSPFPVGFDLVGSGLAVSSRGDWSFRRIEHAGQTMWWPHPQPQFASAVLAEEDAGWIYCYGVTGADGVQRAYLGRVRPDEIERLDRYEYLAGPEPRWSPDVGDAVPLFDGIPNEMSVSYNHHLGQYLAVHSLNQSDKIVGRTAPHPWGPWSAPVVLWTVEVEREEPPRYPTLIYAGKEHPELAEDDGRVLYLTYIEFEEYFPHLVEVTLE